MKKITNIKNPVKTAVDSAINVTVDIEGCGTEVSFTASSNDVTEYGKAIYQAALAGEFGTVADYVPPPAPVLTPEQILEKNTLIFNRLLRAATDSAFPLQSAIALGVATDAQKEKLAEIQQYSIDLIAVDLTVTTPDWPAPPASLN